MDKSKDNGAAPSKTKGTSQSSDGITRPDLGDQLKGAAIGAAIALVLSYIAQQVGILQGRLVRYALWGGAIGGLLAGSDQLAKAGSRLTKRDEKWLNVLVAVIGFILIFAVMVGIVSLATWIVNSFLRPSWT
jgi:hypothetical protein